MDPGAGSTVNRDEANAFVSQFDGRFKTPCLLLAVLLLPLLLPSPLLPPTALMHCRG